jgi:signal transduction histidine kinase
MGRAPATGDERFADDLRRLVQEQTALRRVATLVAAGASESDLLAVVTSEIGQLFEADTATMVRWDGDTVRVIGEWTTRERGSQAGRIFAFGGDTITARVVNSAAPARIDSAADLRTEVGRSRWEELGLQAAIGAPIVVDGRVWGVMMATRTTPDDPFPRGSEHGLGDFAALVAQAIANAEARRELAALAAEQAALRRVATLVAAGRPQAEVLDAATREAGELFAASVVQLVRWEGVHDEVAVLVAWSPDGVAPLPPGSLYHPTPGGATLNTLETGFSSRADEGSPELGPHTGISAPVIVNARLVAALTALREPDEPFESGADVRLRSFADLVAQSLSNTLAREELQASRARMVRAGDEARAKLERNLHDGAQQRLVAVSVSLRLATAKLANAPDEARAVLESAAEELTQATQELRELARGIHPAILTEHGLARTLEVVAARTPLPVNVSIELDERLPPQVEATAYYVVAESLTNAARYAGASKVDVRVSRDATSARVEVVDDGSGGADLAHGSGLRGLADRVEALNGHLHVVSPPDEGTRVWADIPLPPA